MQLCNKGVKKLQAFSGGRTEFVDGTADQVLIALLADIAARRTYDARIGRHLTGAKPAK